MDRPAQVGDALSHRARAGVVRLRGEDPLRCVEYYGTMYILCASSAMHPLEPLAQLYRDFAARADDRAQERVGRCLLRVVLHCDVQMLKLIVSELFNHSAQE